jgi:FixJ family two-component response regulator
MRRIYLVDDDDSVLRTLSRLLRIEGFDVFPFVSPTDFLRSLNQARSGCVIVDLKMPEMSGIELYDAMRRGGCNLPLIILTGQGVIADSVLAMKRGATNFLTKPASREDILGAIDEAFRIQDARQAEDLRTIESGRKLESLTPREREVCLKVTQGLLNKQIAGDLGVTLGTIKAHRARVMEKMEANSVADLVRLVDRGSGEQISK